MRVQATAVWFTEEEYQIKERREGRREGGKGSPNPLLKRFIYLFIFGFWLFWVFIAAC